MRRHQKGSGKRPESDMRLERSDEVIGAVLPSEASGSEITVGVRVNDWTLLEALPLIVSSGRGHRHSVTIARHDHGARQVCLNPNAATSARSHAIRRSVMLTTTPTGCPTT